MKLRKADPEVRAEEVWEYKPAMAGAMQAGEPLGRYDYQLSVSDRGSIWDALSLFEACRSVWNHEFGSWGLIEDTYIEGD